jgi:hypothetical protein
MRQQVIKFYAGSATVLTSFLIAHAVIGQAPARAESFDTRWTAVGLAQKGDRLGSPARATESSVVFYNDPKAALTIATKVAVAKSETLNLNKARDLPREIPNENARQDKPKKLPVGCEPSFSPVTTPSMANVTGRCLAARDGATKVAELVR